MLDRWTQNKITWWHGGCQSLVREALHTTTVLGRNFGALTALYKIIISSLHMYSGLKTRIVAERMHSPMEFWNKHMKNNIYKTVVQVQLTSTKRRRKCNRNFVRFIGYHELRLLSRTVRLPEEIYLQYIQWHQSWTQTRFQTKISAYSKMARNAIKWSPTWPIFSLYIVAVWWIFQGFTPWAPSGSANQGHLTPPIPAQQISHFDHINGRNS